MRDDLKKDHIAVNWTCSNLSHDFQAIFWHCNLRRSSDSHSYIYWDNTLQTVVWTLGSMFDATFYLCQRPEALCSYFFFLFVVCCCYFSLQRQKKANADMNVSETWIKSIVKIYFELNILEFHCHQLDCHIRTEGDWWTPAWWFKLLSSQLKKKKKAPFVNFICSSCWLAREDDASGQKEFHQAAAVLYWQEISATLMMKLFQMQTERLWRISWESLSGARRLLAATLTQISAALIVFPWRNPFLPSDHPSPLIRSLNKTE